MKKLYLICLISIIPFFGSAQACSDLFISEYIEGSSFNKIIEIYNPTSGTIDLSVYKLMTFFNGNDTTAPSNQMFLSGQLASKDVYILCHNSADSSVKAIADATNSFVANWNGNDAVVLLNTLTGDTLDIIGQVGVNPGQTGWPVDTGTTTNHTLVRKPGTQEGLTNWAASSATWYAYDINNFNYLGSHTMDACGNVSPSLYFLSDTMSVPENVGTFSVKVGITNPNNNPTSVDVKISGGTATEGVDYTFTNPTPITFPANSSSVINVSGSIINDLMSESDETIELSLSNQTNGATIAVGKVKITLVDNDGLSIVNPNTESSVIVYPEITEGTISVSCNRLSDVTIYNVYGSAVFSKKDISGNVKINLDGYTSGIYIVEVKNDAARKVAKVILK